MHKSSRRCPPAQCACVLDDVWPETASMVAEMFGAGDQLIAPGLWPGPAAMLAQARPSTRRARKRSRAISPCAGSPKRPAGCANAPISSATGNSRGRWRGQSTIAPAIWWSRRAWLPWLDEAGALGGRSFDVVMSRYPLGEIHRRLDAAAAEFGPSSTIADFRADPELVEREAELLARARRIITPHHGIAAMFPGRTMRLAWHRPPALTARARHSSRLPRPDHRPPAAGHRPPPRELARRAADRLRASDRAAVGRSGNRAAVDGAGLALWNRRDPSPG